MKKYELTDDSITFMGRKLFRIRALISFNDVKAGDLDGYVEKEENLSHIGNAWVYDNARVYGDAWVCGDARVFSEMWQPNSKIEKLMYENTPKPNMRFLNMLMGDDE